MFYLKGRTFSIFVKPDQCTQCVLVKSLNVNTTSSLLFTLLTGKLRRAPLTQCRQFVLCLEVDSLTVNVGIF